MSATEAARWAKGAAVNAACGATGTVAADTGPGLGESKGEGPGRLPNPTPGTAATHGEPPPLPPVWLAVHHAADLTLATRRCLVPAAQVQALDDALQLARSLQGLHDSEATRIAQAEQQARAQGLAEGRARGQAEARAEAATAVAARLRAIDQGVQQQQQQLQAALVPLALLVVRRVLGTLGAEAVTAALVHQALQQVLAPQPGAASAESCVLRLHPALLEGVRSALGEAAARVHCQPDASLAPLDVVIETPGARVLAGLETQLQRVQAALASLPPAALQPADDDTPAPRAAAALAGP